MRLLLRDAYKVAWSPELWSLSRSQQARMFDQELLDAFCDAGDGGDKLSGRTFYEAGLSFR